MLKKRSHTCDIGHIKKSGVSSAGGHFSSIKRTRKPIYWNMANSVSITTILYLHLIIHTIHASRDCPAKPSMQRVDHPSPRYRRLRE